VVSEKEAEGEIEKGEVREGERESEYNESSEYRRRRGGYVYCCHSKEREKNGTILTWLCATAMLCKNELTRLVSIELCLITK